MVPCLRGWSAGGSSKATWCSCAGLGPWTCQGAGTHVPRAVGGSASPESPVALALGAFELLEHRAGATRTLVLAPSLRGAERVKCCRPDAAVPAPRAAFHFCYLLRGRFYFIFFPKRSPSSVWRSAQALSRLTSGRWGSLGAGRAWSGCGQRRACCRHPHPLSIAPVATCDFTSPSCFRDLIFGFWLPISVFKSK